MERYAGHPALELWHVNNEYGCHVSHCYCDVSAAAFREWLAAKYGSIEELNRAWGTAFWSQRYDAFEEVMPPRAAPTFRNPTQLLDFDRFSSDELLACYRAEVEVIRRALVGADHDELHGLLQGGGLLGVGTARSTSSRTTPTPTRPTPPRPRMRRWCATSCDRSAAVRRGSSWSSRRAP